MSPVHSSEGLPVNWINYHTRVKDVFFRMEATNKEATVFISLEHNDPDIRELYFEQFLEFRSLLHATMQEEWVWQQEHITDGRVTSRISTSLEGVSIFRRDDWPELISFFKPRIIALDEFWENARYSFDALK